MLYEEAFLQKANEAVGRDVIASATARMVPVGSLLGKSGLLCGTKGALVFVEEEIMRPGQVTVWRLEDITSHRVDEDLLNVKLVLATSSGPVQFMDLRAEQASAVLSACGLSPSSPEQFSTGLEGPLIGQGMAGGGERQAPRPFEVEHTHAEQDESRDALEGMARPSGVQYGTSGRIEAGQGKSRQAEGIEVVPKSPEAKEGQRPHGKGGQGQGKDARVAGSGPRHGKLPPLHQAVEERNNQELQKWLLRGVDVDQRARDGSTPLIRAASTGNNEAVALLLQRGADPNARAKDGTTALIAAARNRRADVSLLIEAGADLDIPGRDGVTALHKAIAEGCVEHAEALVRAGANLELKGFRKKVTPLLLAMSQGRKDLVRLLLAAGADPHVVNSQGRGLVYYAKKLNLAELLPMDLRREYEAYSNRQALEAERRREEEAERRERDVDSDREFENVGKTNSTLFLVLVVSAIAVFLVLYWTSAHPPGGTWRTTRRRSALPPGSKQKPMSVVSRTRRGRAPVGRPRRDMSAASRNGQGVVSSRNGKEPGQGGEAVLRNTGFGGLIEVLRAARPSVRQCYHRHKRSGVVRVKLVIKNDGTVADARVEGKFAGTPTGRCVLAKVRRLVFPRFRQPKIVVTFPFVLSK